MIPLLSVLYGLVTHPQMAMLLAAAGTDPTNSDGNVQLPNGYISLLQLGFVGVVLLDVVGTHKFLVPRWTLDRDTQAHLEQMKIKDELIANLRADVSELKLATGELQRLTGDKLIPALVQSTEVSRAYVAELTERRFRQREAGHNDEPIK